MSEQQKKFTQCIVDALNNSREKLSKTNIEIKLCYETLDVKQLYTYLPNLLAERSKHRYDIELWKEALFELYNKKVGRTGE